MWGSLALPLGRGPGEDGHPAPVSCECSTAVWRVIRPKPHQRLDTAIPGASPRQLRARPEPGCRRVPARDHDLGLRFEKCPSPSTCRLFTPASWQRCGVRSCRARLARRGAGYGTVWPFIRSQPGLWTDGHNIFLCHHPTQLGAPIRCDFGVEVERAFEPAGEVYATETPGGEAAVAVHCGPYNRMNEAHDAIEMDGGEPEGVPWPLVGDLWRSDARSGRH